jgi:hypothetical protein
LAQTHGLAAAHGWQDNPYVLLPGAGFGEYLWQHAGELAEVLPAVEHLDWPDVTFDFDTGRTAFFAHMATVGWELAGQPGTAAASIDRGRCWARVTSLDAYLRTPQMAPWLKGPDDLLAPFRRDAVRWLVVEAWEEKVVVRDARTGAFAHEGLPPYPDVSLIPRLAPWDWHGHAHLYPNPACRSGRAYGAGFCNVSRCQFASTAEARLLAGNSRLLPDASRDPRLNWCLQSETPMLTGAMMALLTLAYLAQSDEYPVEVTPVLTPAQQRRSAKAREKRPELREDVPHWIYLDPLRAREYQREARDDQGGTHASPVGHWRRGHWRTLRAERYSAEKRGTRLRIKPMWVGPTEWLHEGARYRVVPSYEHEHERRAAT